MPSTQDIIDYIQAIVQLCFNGSSFVHMMIFVSDYKFVFKIIAFGFIFTQVVAHFL